MRGTPTVVIEEEEEESVHDGDEDATPERDSETRVAWVSPAWSRGLKFPPSGLKTVESGVLGAETQVAPEGSGSVLGWRMAQNMRGRTRLGGGPAW